MSDYEDDDFMQEGGKSFSFDGIPPIIAKGWIRTKQPVKSQQRDYDTGDLLTWQDGSPKWQWRVDLQTDLRESPQDDGIRSVYLKFKSRSAVVAAIKAAGCERMEYDGYLELAYVSDDHSQPHRRVSTCTPSCQQGKGYPIKNYEAVYQPPGEQFDGIPTTPTHSENTEPVVSMTDKKLAEHGVPEAKIATMDEQAKELMLTILGA